MILRLVIVAILALFTVSQNIELVLSDQIQTINQENAELFYYSAKLPSDFSFLYFRVTTNNDSIYARIYVSAKSSSPNYDFSEYKGIDYNNTIYYPASELEIYHEISVGIECNEQCNSTLEYGYIIQGGYIEVNEENKKFDIRITKSEDFLLIYHVTNPKQRTLISVISSGINNFETYLIYNPVYDISQNVTMPQLFYNGYGIVIGENDFIVEKESSFYLWITPSYYEDIFTIEIKQLSNNPYENPTFIRPMQVVTSLIGNLDTNLECFNIEHDFTNKYLQPKDTISYTIHGYSYTRNAYLYLYNKQSSSIVNGKLFNGPDYFDFEIKQSEQSFLILCVGTGTSNENDSNNLATIQFQVFDADKIEEIYMQPYLMFLTRGLPLVSKLKQGTCAYYQVTTYAMNAEELQAQLRAIKGSPNLYIAISIDYPNEQIYSSEIDELLELNEISQANHINENHFVKMNIKGEASYKVGDPVIAIIDCPYNEVHENDCIYSLTLSNENDKIILIEGVKFSTAIKPNETQYYTFDLKDKSIKRIRIALYSFSGDADLHVYTYLDKSSFIPIELDDIYYYAVGNKEYYDISFNNTDINDIMTTYYIEVTGKTNAYYSIYYETNDNVDETKIYVDPGEITTEAVHPNKTTSLYFHNRDIYWQTDFFISIHSMNCELNITLFDNEKMNEIRDFKYYVNVSTNENEYYMDYYKVTISVNKMDVISKRDYCLVYICSGELNLDRDIILNEGIPHKMEIIPTINEIYYVYPYQPRTGGTFYNEQIISITKYSENDMSVEYQVGNNNFISYNISTYSYKIVISANEIESECEHNVCRILIRVAPIYENDTVQYDIRIFGVSPSPVYLPRGEYRIDVIKSFQRIIYYTEYAYNDESEIIVHFKRGTGNAIAAIYSKSYRNLNGWNRRFEIPDKYSFNLIPFDHDNKKFVLPQNKSDLCDEDGCIIVIVIETYDSPKQSIRRRLNEFIIYTRMKFITAVNLPENEIAFGALSTSFLSKEVDIFNVKIERDTNKVFILFDCELGELSVKLIPNDNEESKEWILKGFQSGYEINVNMLSNINSFKGRTFKLVPYVKGFNYEDDIHYSLKLISPLPVKDKKVIDVRSNHNEFCYAKESKDACYFVLPLYEYHRVDFVHLFVLNELNPSSRIIILAEVISKERFETSSNIMDLFPTDSPTYSSEQQFNTETLFISLTEYTYQDLYITIKVIPYDKGTITFMNTIYNARDETSVTAGSHELFALPKASKTKLVLPGTDGYFVEVVVVSGVGIVSSYNYESLTLEDEGRDSASFIIPHNIPYTEMNIASNNDDDLLFYVHYISRPFTRNIDKISFGDSNYIEYSHNHFMFFPLIYYIDVNELDGDNDIAVTIQIKHVDFLSIKHSLNEIFDIGIKYFNDSELGQLYSGNETIFEPIMNAYDPFFKVFLITFDSKRIFSIKGHKYVAFQIQPNSKNKNIYFGFHLNIICYNHLETKVKTEIPKREYYFSTVQKDKYQLLPLRKGSFDDRYYTIEYFSNFDAKILFADGEKTNIDGKDESLHVETNQLFGKYCYIVYLKENADSRLITMSISNENPNYDIKYAIKYETTPQPKAPHFQLRYVIVKTKEYNGTISFELLAPETIEGNPPDKTVYTIRIYNSNEAKLEDLDKFYYTKIPKYSYSTVITSPKENVNLTLTIPYKGIYHASIIASIDYGYESEFLQYKAFSFEILPISESNKKYSFKVILIITSIIIEVLLIIAIVIYILKKKRKKGATHKDLPNIEEDTIQQINSLTDTISSGIINN